MAEHMVLSADHKCGKSLLVERAMNEGISFHSAWLRQYREIAHSQRHRDKPDDTVNGKSIPAFSAGADILCHSGWPGGGFCRKL
jgi:hypothetical protein